MSSPARATVIVVNYNGAHLLPACLDAVRAQDLPGADYRTVVVDNASTDESAQVLARYPWVEVIASAVNRGFAGGNNLAFDHLDTPYAVLLNNDAVPEPTWLRSLLAPFDRPGHSRTAVVTGKVLFQPRFVQLSWQTDPVSPAAHDPRELGARVHAVRVDGVNVTDKVLWERLTYAPETVGSERFRWTRPGGELLVPLSSDAAAEPIVVEISVSAPVSKPLTVSCGDTTATALVTPEAADITLRLPAGTSVVDVINNAGGVVLANGYGADRGFQEVDTGQLDEPVEVFAGCGNGMAIRSIAGRSVGWFDDDFFLYYEDTDLSWRLRRSGWHIWYEPSAVVRHLHSASSREWSPDWVFHVDRNRLLMLVKDASVLMAVREVLHYPASAASMAVRAAREAWIERRRPGLSPHLLRLKVLGSFVRLLPRMLISRRAIRQASTVSRREVERWLVRKH